MIMARIFILGHTKDTGFLYNGIILKKFNYSLNDQHRVVVDEVPI